MSAWTGRLLLVWGGESGALQLGDGARYDPAVDRWTAIASAGAPVARRYAASAWTGTEWIVWGGDTWDGAAEHVFGDGARYDPVADTWRSIASSGAPDARYHPHVVWTGAEMIVWGGIGCGAGGMPTASPRPCDDGARYDPARNRWRPLQSNGAPAARNSALAVWTGRVMVVWGGDVRACNGGNVCSEGAAYDPVADTWTPLSERNAPTPRAMPAFVWTGTQLLIWSGFGGENAVGGTASWTP